jgi:hypothetical protein
MRVSLVVVELRPRSRILWPVRDVIEQGMIAEQRNMIGLSEHNSIKELHASVYFLDEVSVFPCLRFRPFSFQRSGVYSVHVLFQGCLFNSFLLKPAWVNLLERISERCTSVEVLLQPVGVLPCCNHAFPPRSEPKKLKILSPLIG